MRATLGEWADSYRSRGRYTPVGVAFHWVMAAVVIFQLVSGWMMQRYPVGTDKIEAYRLHSEIGLTLLLLGVLRLLWRLIVPGPINAADWMGWRTTLAHTLHVIFYALFVILPVSGWIMWSSIGPPMPLSLAGLVEVPPMPFAEMTPEWRMWLLDWAEDVHAAGVVLLTLLVPIHAVAAVKHHFWDRDEVLEGMLPEVPDDPSHPAGSRHTPPQLEVPSRATDD